MARFLPLIRRIISGGAAPPAAGFIASVVKVGVAVSHRFTLLASAVAPAFAVSIGRNSLRVSQTPAVAASLLGAQGSALSAVSPGIDVTQSAGSLSAASTPIAPAMSFVQSLRAIAASTFTQRPAIDTALLGASGSAVKPSVLPGVQTSARISEFHTDALPAANIVQVVYDLTRLVGANVASNAVGTWTNPTGAQSVHNGTTATSAGAATGGSRKLQLAYANHVNKGELAITQAKLFLYAAVTGDPTGLLSDVTITYDIGAGEVTLETIAGNFSNLTTPREYDLTGLLDNWTEYNALTVFVNHVWAATSVGVSCAVDACEVEILANKTDTL